MVGLASFGIGGNNATYLFVGGQVQIGYVTLDKVVVMLIMEVNQFGAVFVDQVDFVQQIVLDCLEKVIRYFQVSVTVN